MVELESVDLPALLERLERVELGCGYGGLHPEDVGRLWDRARRHGATRLVLEVWLEEDGYHTGVRVLERK